MDVPSIILDHEKIFNQSGPVKVQCSKMRKNKAACNEGPTDAANINQQVCQHVHRLVVILCVSTQFNRDLERLRCFVVLRCLGVKDLLAHFVGEEAEFGL